MPLRPADDDDPALLVALQMVAADTPPCYFRRVSNPYYDPGVGRAARVKDLFATIAPRYDLINDVQSFGLHRLWKRKLFRLSGAQPGQRALDVCCGTGDIALALARAGAEVTGVDFSGPMLEVAAARSRDRSQSGVKVKWMQGDAMSLPFPDNSFDVVSVGYGLRNLADWEAGLREMVRVARPGGRVLVLDFGKPDNRLWRSIYFGYLRVFVPMLGRVFASDPAAYSYILESLHHYPAQRGVEEAMQRMGLSKPTVTNILGGVMSINRGTKAEG
jgi:demethylmenaquinone methyltransferase/2-methoxy-6-polyprenyl-1,4-benzoquinol methylase